jgi:hypothetical protein
MEEEVKAVPEATPSLVNMHISSHKIGHPQFFLINYPWEDTVDEDITLHWLVELSKFIFGNSRSLGVVVLEKKIQCRNMMKMFCEYAIIIPQNLMKKARRK